MWRHIAIMEAFSTLALNQFMSHMACEGDLRMCGSRWVRAARGCVCCEAWGVRKVQASGGGLLEERARRHGAHLARCASRILSADG